MCYMSIVASTIIHCNYSRVSLIACRIIMHCSRPINYHYTATYQTHTFHDSPSPYFYKQYKKEVCANVVSVCVDLRLVEKRANSCQPSGDQREDGIHKVFQSLRLRYKVDEDMNVRVRYIAVFAKITRTYIHDVDGVARHSPQAAARDETALLHSTC